MPPEERDEQMTVRLTPTEILIRNELARLLGTDWSSVMRMGMLKMARENGITAETVEKKATRQRGKATRV